MFRVKVCNDEILIYLSIFCVLTSCLLVKEQEVLIILELECKMPNVL